MGPGTVMRMQTKAGTSYYMAPEVLKESYTEKCDYWSLGVLLYVLLVGFPPFEGENEEEVLRAVRDMEYSYEDEAWWNVSDEAKDLIDHLLVPEEERFSIKEILKHPWIRKFSKKAAPVRMSTIPVNNLRKHCKRTDFRVAITTFVASRVSTDDIKEETALFN